MTAAAGLPCRPYVIGEHARAIRRRILVAAAIALVAALVVPLLVRAGLDAVEGPQPIVAGVVDVAGFAVVYLLTLWLATGPRRLAAVEILVWGSRYASAGYAAVTGIRDPADAVAAAAWLRAHPAEPDEDPETRYWRAHAHLVAGDTAGARSLIPPLATIAEYRFAVASLQAQLALAEGTAPDLDAVSTAAGAWPDPLGRAVAYANLGALRGQRALVCDEDDVAAVLTVRGGVGGRPSRFFLFRIWLPIIGLTVGALVLGVLVGT